MYFKSTASFTNHGSTPFVECETARLVIESSMYLLRWTKHEYCHTNVSKEVVDNSAFRAFHMAADRHRRMRQLVLFTDNVSQAIVISTSLTLCAAFVGCVRMMIMDQSCAKIEALQAMAITG